MSTKLFHGYRVTGLAGGWDVVDFANRFSAALQPVYGGLFLLLATNVAAVVADSALLGDPLEGAERQSPWGYARRYMDKRLKAQRSSGLRDVVFDLQCQVTFLPDPAAPADLYALLFTEKREYRVTWEAMSGVEPWPYWDNVDRPAQVEETEWHLRSQVWGRVCPPGVSPSALGVTKTFLGDFHHFRGPSRQQLLNFMPPRAERARNLARAQAHREASKAAGRLVPPPRGPALDQLAAEIEPRLAELTPEMLLEGPRR